MNTIRWAIILLLSASLGVLTVQYLVATPQKMTLFALLAVLALVGLLAVLVLMFRGWMIALGMLVLLVGFAGGWLGMNSLFLSQEYERDLPALNLPPPDARDHTAVIYLTHGEPPGYSAEPWVETFKEMDALKAEFIPVPFRPFFFYAFRGEYLKLGGSPHNIMHQAMQDSLERMYRAEGDDSTRFYIAFLDSDPRPDEAVIHALNEGASKVIVANVFLTISSHTEAGLEMIKEAELEEQGVPICYAEPLWDSDFLRQMFVERSNRFLNGADKSKTGVLLVGHGQPASWDKVWPTQTSQEQEFRDQVTELLVADGFKRENVASAWMEFKQPDAAEKAAELGQTGVEKIFVFSAAISASSLHSLYDVPDAVRSANLPPGIEVVNLGAWDNDPLVIQAIKEKIDRCK